MAVLKHTNPVYMNPSAAVRRPAVSRPRCVPRCLGGAGPLEEAGEEEGGEGGVSPRAAPVLKSAWPRNSVACNARTVYHANATIQEIVTFPGEDAPGTGRRAFPQGPEEEELTDHLSAFQGRSTAECYDAFPFEAHASCPLCVDDDEPSGAALSHLPGMGPATGVRKRPGLVDEDDYDRPRQPTDHHSKTDRLIEVHARHGDLF